MRKALQFITLAAIPGETDYNVLHEVGIWLAFVQSTSGSIRGEYGIR